MSGVYLNLDHKAVSATLAILRHYRAFLASDCRRMNDPYDGRTLGKEQATARLHYLVDVAITRKGIQAGCLSDDSGYRKMQSDYQTWLMRDNYRLRDIARRIRIYQFESPECKSRFAHLLSDRSDY